jgi:hypothetical protein
MAKSSSLMQRYARIGVQARLTELKTEIAEIERAFPDLGSPVRRTPGRPRAAANGQPVNGVTPAAPQRRTRKPMTAAQKKAVGDRMKNYWAAPANCPSHISFSSWDAAQRLSRSIQSLSWPPEKNHTRLESQREIAHSNTQGQTVSPVSFDVQRLRLFMSTTLAIRRSSTDCISIWDKCYVL